MQNLVQRRQDGARALAALVTTYLVTASKIGEIIAELVSSGGNYVDGDLDGTPCGDIDVAKLNYLRDAVWPNIQATHNAPFDGVAGHETNVSMLRAIARLL